MKKTTTKRRRDVSRQQIRTGDEARSALIDGIELMAMLLRPTLGPLARTVAVESILPGRPPEVLDDAATICRRVEQLPNPFEDMGAMQVRQMTWKVRESVGDGAASAAVIAHSLVKQAFPFITAGGDPDRLTAGIERGADIAIEELRRMATPVTGRHELMPVVSGALMEREVAEVVAETIESVGADGTVRTEEGYLHRTVCEYHEGMQWETGVVSSYFLPSSRGEARLIEPTVLATNYRLNETSQLLPILEACLNAGHKTLFLIASNLSGSALELLIANIERRVLDKAVVVKAPGSGFDQIRILEDIAIVTGGRLINRERGDRLRDVRAEDMGGAHEVWATSRAFGILSGKGTKDAVRARVSEAHAQLEDSTETAITMERIAKLTGISAVIQVGGVTKSERAERRPRIEAAIKSAQAAFRDGVVPGGGSALIASGHSFRDLDVKGDESVGMRMLARSLEEPMRAIADNAGFDGGMIAGEANKRKGTWMFDVLRGEWAEGNEARVLDALPVVLTSLQAAVDLAKTTISTEGLVRSRRPLVTIDP